MSGRPCDGQFISCPSKNESAKVSQVDLSSQDPKLAQAKQGDGIIVDNPDVPRQCCYNDQHLL